MLCPECGYMMSAFDKECPRCQGKGLPQTPQTQHLPATPPPPYAAPTVPIQSGHNPAGYNPAGYNPAGHSPAAAPAAFAGTAPAPSPQYCNGCGTPNVGAAAFCAGCGNSLTALAPVAAAPTDSWVAPQPAYPPQSYQQPYPPQTYPPAIQQQQSYAPPQQPYGQPIQNNVNVVVTQQNNNSAGWLAALLVLLFGTPLGCIAIPAALVLMAVAFQFTPLIIAALIAVAIGKSTMQQDQKTIAILVTLGVGAVANIALIGAMHSP